MTHSKKYATVKKYYNTLKADGTRMWNKSMVENAVVKGWITEEECDEILGDD
jgi:hypothetical protein